MLMNGALSDHVSENSDQNVIKASSPTGRKDCKKRGDGCILDDQCCGDSTCDFVATAGLVIITKCDKE